MASLKEESLNFQGVQVKNITDLNEVDINLNLEERESTNKETGEAFKYKVICLNGEEYRVPGKVIGDIKSILEAKPDLSKIKVTKKGTGLQTQYTVIPLS